MYEHGAPIFIFVGGEGKIVPFDIDLKSMKWVDWANQHNAAKFVLEHRYYGLSTPSSKGSDKKYEWLSSRYPYYLI